MGTHINANKKIFAYTLLSSREMDVALLARTRAGRNAVSQILGLSVNSIKTIFKRIENKLGSDWRNNPDIIWPDYREEHTEEETAAAEEEQEEFENGYYHRLLRLQQQQFKGRQTSFRLLLKQSKPGKDILHVSSSQRFWLRPLLKELEDDKIIKLLSVDWNETYAPPWLPLVNRGRKEIRAADYITYNSRHVTAAIKNYLDHRLRDRIMEINEILDEVRTAARRTNKTAVPDITRLAASAFANFTP